MEGGGRGRRVIAESDGKSQKIDGGGEKALVGLGIVILIELIGPTRSGVRGHPSSKTRNDQDKFTVLTTFGCGLREFSV